MPRKIEVSAFEDNSPMQSLEDDFEFLTIDDSDSDSDVVLVKDRSRASSKRPDSSQYHRADPLGNVVWPWTVIKRYRMTGTGTVIKENDTIELKNTVKRDTRQLNSGDFLRVKQLILNMETDELKIRGLRMIRTRYHGQIFDWKLNELVMVIRVTESDAQSPFDQGLEDVSLKDVVQMRDCVITNKPYPMLTYQEANTTYNMDRDLRKEFLFHQGRLVCRAVHIVFVNRSGKDYSGMIRGFYGHEADKAQGRTSENVEKRDVLADTPVFSASDKPRQRTPSFEEVEHHPARRSLLPTKTTRYTFGDVFCGAGGASTGASNAGLVVIWGLDNDESAMQAYAANYTEAYTLKIDAHNFPGAQETRALLRVDVLHLSPPCCYWSPAHTNAGQNDQANFEAIYTVGPILEKVKPRVATLEQTFGLLTHGEHKKNFKLLMYDIIKAGYNVRYKIADMSEYGLPQRRKRLLIIASRRGTPLPPFPSPTHGEAGSGLKRFKSVYDALLPIRCSIATPISSRDQYHQPDAMKRVNKPPYDPHNCMLPGCITTGGGGNHHYSGERRYTAREMSLFQSFPHSYIFTGSHTEALKQIGNAFPPVMAEAMFRSISQTLEAYDHGLIGPEESIYDLHAQLRAKGVQLPERLLPASQPRTPMPSRYRYLYRVDSGSSATNTDSTNSNRSPGTSSSSALFNRSHVIEPRRALVEPEPRRRFFGLLDESDRGVDETGLSYAGFEDGGEDDDKVVMVETPVRVREMRRRRNYDNGNGNGNGKPGGRTAVVMGSRGSGRVDDQEEDYIMISD